MFEGHKLAGKAVRAAALALCAASALAAGSAVAAPDDAKGISLNLGSFSGFTPANADPRLAAQLSRSARSISDFTITPAAAKDKPRQVRVAVRAKSNNAASALSNNPTGSSALTPTTYNLGAAVGWKRFALSGDVTTRDDRANPAIGREASAKLGLSYDLGKKVSTRVAVGAEQRQPALTALGSQDAYSVDLGTEIKLSKRIAVTGGVRYRIEEDKAVTLSDQRRDSQAVYVGTAFKF